MKKLICLLLITVIATQSVAAHPVNRKLIAGIGCLIGSGFIAHSFTKKLETIEKRVVGGVTQNGTRWFDKAALDKKMIDGFCTLVGGFICTSAVGITGLAVTTSAIRDMIKK